MKFIKKCAVSALCLSLLAGSAASLNIVPATITAPTAITAQAAATMPLPSVSGYVSFYYGNDIFMLNKDKTAAIYIGPKTKGDQDANFPSKVVYGGKTYTVTSVGIPTTRGYDTTYLKSVVNIKIPSTVTTINKWSFYQTNLQTVTFVKANGTKESTTLATSSDLATIEEGAFSRCQMTGFPFDVTKSLKYIGLQGFSYLKHFQSNVDFPATLQYIGNYAFAGCEQLQRFDITGGIKTPGYLYYVGNGAFKECSNLKSFVVGSIGGRSLSLGTNGNIEAVFDTSKRKKVDDYSESLKIAIRSSSSKYYFGCRFENASDYKAVKDEKIVIVDGYKIIFRDNNGNEITPKILNK